MTFLTLLEKAYQLNNYQFYELLVDYGASEAKTTLYFQLLKLDEENSFLEELLKWKENISKKIKTKFEEQKMKLKH